MFGLATRQGTAIPGAVVGAVAADLGTPGGVLEAVKTFGEAGVEEARGDLDKAVAGCCCAGGVIGEWWEGV